MGLLVTLYLISSNVYSSLQAPIQRGFSYIEIFLMGTQGVIFFAILEYGFILAWKKYSNIWNDFIRVVLFQIKIRLFIQIILIVILNFEFHILAELIGSSIL